MVTETAAPSLVWHGRVLPELRWMAIYWWVHLWLQENIHSQEATTERNRPSATIHQRACKISEKSNHRQIPNLWEGKETSQSHHRDTETPALSLQEKEQYLDKCTRTTTEDALAHKPQETYRWYTNKWRMEEDKKGVTSTSCTTEGIGKRGRNGSTSLWTESQYVAWCSSTMESYGEGTDAQNKPWCDRSYHNRWSLYPTRRSHTQWKRGRDAEGIYLSIRKSMQLCVFIHLSHKRDEAAALLDSGATENFIQESYAQQLKLPVKCLPHTWPVYNVDGTLNKNGHIHSYTNLEMQTGQQRTKLCFFLTDIGNQKLILGYPWFTATQPNINWAQGWIEADQLLLIICTPEKKKVHIGKCSTMPMGRHTIRHPYMPANGSLYVAQIRIAGEGSSTSKKQTLTSKLAEQAGLQKGSGEIPAKYQWHSHVFSEEVAQHFPESQIWDHAIELKPNAPSTIPRKVYQLTQDEQKALLDFVTEQQAKGYICPLKSPYMAPFFFIKKKDGKLWPVQDYQQLNEWTIKNQCPLLLISELIAWIQNAKIFTKVNVRWGYNNICIKKGDEHKAAFITNQGLFEPTVMFFGLMSSPATFQTMMNAIFTPEIAEGWLIVYMDDILITTQDDPKFHEECVHCILEKLHLHDLYLKPEKCVFEQQWMEFLGVVLENETVQMDPAKLKGIMDWPQPQHITDVCAFLGFMGFYQYFVPNYSNIAWPLIQLTKKNAVFKWTEECKVAFEQLKMLMCSCPILWQPDYTKAFFLATDTLAYGIGTIPLQEGEINPCTLKPMLCPVVYYSATFTPTQCNYDIYS